MSLEDKIVRKEEIKLKNQKAIANALSILTLFEKACIFLLARIMHNKKFPSLLFFCFVLSLFLFLTPQAHAYTFVNKISNLCLDITGNSHIQGAKFELWQCNGHTNQQFSYTYALRDEVSLLAYYNIKPANTSPQLCMDVTGGEDAISNGIVIEQWNCYSPAHTNQAWRLFGPYQDNVYRIQADNSGKCIEPESAFPGAIVRQQTCGANDRQLWYVNGTP